MQKILFPLLLWLLTAAVPVLAQSSNQMYDEGLRLSAAGKCEEAIPLFNKATAQTPYFYQAFLEAGKCHLRLEQTAQALKSFHAALEVYPEYYEALTERGYVYSKTGKEKEAMADFGKAVSLRPERAEAYAYRGMLHAKNGRNKAALEDFDAALKADPGNGGYYYQRAKLHEASGKNTSAIADYQKAGETANIGDAWLKYGLLKSAAGDYSAAVDGFNKAEKAGVKSKELTEGRAKAHFALAAYGEALKDYNKLIQEFRDSSPDMFYHRGICHQRTGNLEAAMKDLNRAVTQNPALDSALLIMASISTAQGKTQQAQIYYTRAINANPSSGEAYAGRADILFSQKKYSQALADYDQAVKYAPSGHILFSRALCHDMMGNREAACEDLEAASLLGHKEANQKKSSYCR